MYGGLSAIRSGIFSVHIASLNSPSDVTKSSLEKLYTFFVNGEYCLDLSLATWLKRSENKSTSLNINWGS